MLKAKDEQRAESVIAYARSSDVCRQKQLVEYFGQLDSKDCGVCDVCRARRGREAVRMKLRPLLGADPKTVEAFVADPSNGLPPDAMEIYREMLDE